MKFLKLIILAAKAQQITGKKISDMTWDDVFVVFANDDWIALFEEVVDLF